jgi:hypothetical protein
MALLGVGPLFLLFSSTRPPWACVIPQVEAEVAADYMGQAEGLLKEGQPGKFDHVPAAVLVGAVLEKALRTLCNKQQPPVSIVNAKGEPRTLNPLIDELKKAGVFNELKANNFPVRVARLREDITEGAFIRFAEGAPEVRMLRRYVGDF